MFSQFEPNVKATVVFLKLLNVKVNAVTVNEILQNHPDWPSLLCISDSLNKWNVPNEAGKIDVTNIDELPTPFSSLKEKPGGTIPICRSGSRAANAFDAKSYWHKQFFYKLNLKKNENNKNEPCKYEGQTK